MKTAATRAALLAAAVLALALTGCGEKSADNAQAVTPEVVETTPPETPPRAAHPGPTRWRRAGAPTADS